MGKAKKKYQKEEETGRRERERERNQTKSKDMQVLKSSRRETTRDERREEFVGEKSRQTVNKHTPCLRFGKARQISVSWSYLSSVCLFLSSLIRARIHTTACALTNRKIKARNWLPLRRGIFSLVCALPMSHDFVYS